LGPVGERGLGGSRIPTTRQLSIQSCVGPYGRPDVGALSRLDRWWPLHAVAIACPSTPDSSTPTPCSGAHRLWPCSLDSSSSRPRPNRPRLAFMDVKPDEPHLPPLFLSWWWRPGGANDKYGCVLSAQPDQWQGRTITKAGSRPTVSRRPARSGSREAPRPGGRALREGPSLVQSAPLRIFMR